MNSCSNIYLGIRLILVLGVFILLSCSPRETIYDYCFHDEGIKSVVVSAVLVSDKTQSKNETIYYNKIGRPIIREQAERRIELNYDGINLKNTVAQNYNVNKQISTIDTNIVLSNDWLGRPLEIAGADGGSTKYTYKGCNDELSEIRDKNGLLVQVFYSFSNDGLIEYTLWKLTHEDKGQLTTYYDYVFDAKGYWTERKYKYANGDVIFEKRAIEYY